MPRRRLILEDAQGRVLCRCTVADTAHARLRGLLGRRGLARGEGLLIAPAPSVHTCFMRFPIDVVFLGADLEVLGIRARLGPWRLAGQRGARQALELRAGAAAELGLAPGMRLRAAAAP